MKRFPFKPLIPLLSIFLGIAFSANFAISWFYRGNIFEYDPTDVYPFFFLIVLFTIWGGLILYRVQERRIQKISGWIIFLTIIWVYTNFIKRLVPSEELTNLLWYFSYGPMLFIPTLWLALIIASTSRLNVKKFILITDLIDGVLFLLIMLNDLHHLAFYLGSDGRPKHGVLYFIIYGYILISLIIAIALFTVKTKKRNSLFETWPIFAIFLSFIGYSIAFILIGRPFERIPVFGTYITVYSILNMLLLEVTVEAGLVQNTGFYKKKFINSSYRLALANRNFDLIYKNKSFTMNDQIRNEPQDNLIVGNLRYTKKAIDGGYLIKEEDLSSLLNLRNQLEEKQKEINSTTELLKKERDVQLAFEQRQTRERISLKVNDEIAKENAEINRVVNSLPDQLTPETRKQYMDSLTYLKIKICFLKQRCLFVIEGSSALSVSLAQFSLSMGSLSTDLKNSGFTIACSCSVRADLPLDFALKTNALLKSAIDSFGESRGTIIMTVDPETEETKIRLCDIKNFKYEKPDFEVKTEKDGKDLLISFGGQE